MKKLISVLTALTISFASLTGQLSAYSLEPSLGEPLPSYFMTAQEEPQPDMFNAFYGDAPDNPIPEFSIDVDRDSVLSELSETVPLASDDTPASGMCGENISWSFDRETGVLSISGQGDMYDYNYDYDAGSDAPWYALREEITGITVGAGITSIGNSAFRDLPRVKTADIAAGVVRLGNTCFANCDSLFNVTLPDGITSIGYSAFMRAPYLDSIRSQDNHCITPQGYLLQSWTTTKTEIVVIPSEVKVIASHIFAFWNNLKTISITGDCILSGVLAENCEELQNIIIGGRLTLNGCLVSNCPKLKKVMYTYDVERSSPIIRDNTTGKTNIAIAKALRAVSCLPDDPNLNTYSDRTDYNNGFGYFIPRRCAQEIEAPDGTVYVACGVKDVMQIVSPNSGTPILEIKRPGFDFAAACIDGDFNWYIMWSYKISNDIAQEHLEDENIIITKYAFDGTVIDECRMKLKDTTAALPLDFGSASMAVKDDILGVFYNTVWLNGHQGAEFAAINKNTMELVDFSGHQGSHAFGTVLYPTKNGFTGAHLGDAYPRGIAFHSYYVSGSKFSITSNGPVLMHSSGDDTDTHTHWGGFAVGNTTYAVAGKAERCYTSGNYAEFVAAHPQETQIFDVFVRIVDQTLLETDDIGGEDRIDAATGEVADTNVFWLTSCNSSVKAGQVKVVTLENGAYCVLWEKMVNGKFDSIRYVIMDECGNILRHETGIYGARLSNTSIQPIVQGNRLTWATADAEKGTVTWYDVNLEAFGDVNSDDRITSLDAVLILRYLANFRDENADVNAMDYNSSGGVTSLDAVLILRHIAGLD